MTLYYPWPTLLPDLARAGFGALLGAALLSQLTPGSVGFWLVAALTALFSGFGLLTALRVRLRIEVHGEMLHVQPGARRVNLDTLTSLRLDYYATRRDREDGWMQLTVCDRDGNRLRVDSRLEGFGELLRGAAEAASRNQLELEPATVDNLRAQLAPDRTSGLHGSRP